MCRYYKKSPTLPHLIWTKTHPPRGDNVGRVSITQALSHATLYIKNIMCPSYKNTMRENMRRVALKKGVTNPQYGIRDSYTFDTLQNSTASWACSHSNDKWRDCVAGFSPLPPFNSRGVCVLFENRVFWLFVKCQNSHNMKADNSVVVSPIISYVPNHVIRWDVVITSNVTRPTRRRAGRNIKKTTLTRNMCQSWAHSQTNRRTPLSEVGGIS